MTTQVMATVVGDMLRPDIALPLADHSRVRLTIETIDNTPLASGLAAWEEIKRRLKEKPLHLGGVRYTRDELHEGR